MSTRDHHLALFVHNDRGLPFSRRALKWISRKFASVNISSIGCTVFDSRQSFTHYQDTCTERVG
jgi:hypothetical protein